MCLLARSLPILFGFRLILCSESCVFALPFLELVIFLFFIAAVCLPYTCTVPEALSLCLRYPPWFLPSPVPLFAPIYFVFLAAIPAWFEAPSFPFFPAIMR